MKWIIVLVACLAVVGANLKDIDKESENSLPILRIKQLGEDTLMVPEQEKNSNSLEDAVMVPQPEKEASSSEDSELAESSQENENSENSLKREKKSAGLTTICVEIKPTSPHEPPYFMCKGTDSEHGSYGGKYRPSSYGKGGSYGYEKPSHGESSYGSHEEYYSPGGYSKPKPDKYNYGSHAYGGHEKPSHGAAYEGIDTYGKPIKYQIPYSKPSAPYGEYETHRPAGYGKPAPQYKPQHGGYHSGPYHAAPGYASSGSYSHGPFSAGYGSAAPYGHGSAYKGGSKPTGYEYGKPLDKYHGSSKGSGGYSAHGYRTIVMDDDDEEEVNEVEETPMTPDVGMSVPYSAPQPHVYPKPQPQVYSYPSPAPKVPCGSNLLVGCNPSVQPVPCYRAPTPHQPSVVYNIQPASPMYAPPSVPSVYYPPPPAYPQQRAATGEMKPITIVDQQVNTKAVQNTQTDGISKSTDPAIRFQDGTIDTAPQQTLMKDDKMRQSTEGMQMPTGNMKDTNQSTANQFQHPAIMRQDSAGKMPEAQDMTMNKTEGVRQQPGASDIKTSERSDDERKQFDSMMRMQQMQQMQQIAQAMGSGAPRMADGSNSNMNFGAQGWQA